MCFSGGSPGKPWAPSAPPPPPPNRPEAYLLREVALQRQKRHMWRGDLYSEGNDTKMQSGLLVNKKTLVGA